MIALRLLPLLLALAAPGAAQQHDHAMMGHADPTVLAWRMPPMPPGMPMMPGLDAEVPPVGPFLPGFGLDPMTFPEARPTEIRDLRDGDTTELTASIVRVQLRGRAYLMYGYDGQIPGPVLRAPQGSTIAVLFRNDIEMPTTVHWHGLRLDNRFDGVPGITQDPVARGEVFRYELRFVDAGVFWYHPHMREDIQQDLGLYGNLMAIPTTGDYWNEAHREEFLILDDLLVDAQGMLPWGDDSPVNALMGRFGNVMLVNGRSDYRLKARRGEVIRFYLTNVANSRTFNVTFGGARAKLVGSDLGRFEREEWVDSVVIAPAERYVVEVRFDDPGEVPIENTIQAIDHFRGEYYPHVDHLASVDVASEAVERDLSWSFDGLRTNVAVTSEVDTLRGHFGRPPDHELELTVQVNDLPLPIVLSMEFEKGLYVPPLEWNDTMPMMNWLATGRQVRWILREKATGRENMDIRWRHRVGDVVKIRIFNDPDSFHPMNHPVHVHGQRYLVLSRDGVANDNLVWKDTAIVPVASTVDMLVEMTNPGVWMLHCHIAEHLHAGMMLAFEVLE